MAFATTAELRTGIGIFDAISRGLDRLTQFFSFFGTLGILGIMGLIVADVVARGLLSRPLVGVPEMVAMAILGIVFLQLANTLANGKLTRADVLLDVIYRRSVRAGLMTDAVMHAVGAVLIGVLTNVFWPLFWRVWDRNTMEGTVGQFQAPLWPVYLIVLAGSALLCAVFAWRVLNYLVLALRGTPEPEAAV